MIESYEEEIAIPNDEQQEEKSIKINESWLNVGIGSGSLGLSGGGDINFRVTDQRIFQVSLVESEKYDGFGLGLSTPVESVTSLALLVGVKTKSEHSMTAILIGVGRVNGFHRGERLECSGFFCFFPAYEKNSFTTIGLVGNWTC